MTRMRPLYLLLLLLIQKESSSAVLRSLNDMNEPDLRTQIRSADFSSRPRSQELKTKRYETHSNRILDEVSKLDISKCLLTTSLKTERYVASAKAQGTMFDFRSQASSDVEILSLEFGISREASSLDVQVYYREGSFSGFNSKEQEWEKVADTKAHRSPDSQTAIIPASDFQVFVVKPATTYALYINTQSDQTLTLKTNSKQGIGAMLNTDIALVTTVGVLLPDGPFPSTLGSGQAVDFEGVIHYKTKQDCTDILATTAIPMEFAINSDPDVAVMTELSDTVEMVMDAVISLDPELGRYRKNHMLSIEGVNSDFAGADKRKCPTGFSLCSLITVTINFNHLQSIEPGELRKSVYNEAKTLGNSVTLQSNFEVEFVGAPVVSGEFFVTLEGVSGKMVPNQKRYFERVTSEFFAEFAKGEAIHDIEVFDEVVEGVSNTDKTSDEIRNLEIGSMEEQHRKLQATNKVAMIVYATSTAGELREAVLNTIDSNSERYTSELKLQHLRPGEINENDFGSYFNDISQVKVSIYSTGGGNIGDNELEINGIWMPLSIAGVAISVVWLVFRIYKDCFHSISINKMDFSNIPPKGDEENPLNRGRSQSREALMSRIRSKSRPNFIDDAPRNQAGERGRGIGRSKSLDPTRQFIQKSHSNERLEAMRKTLTRSMSFGGGALARPEGKPPVSNVAGQNGRRSAPSRSMSMPMGKKVPSLEKHFEDNTPNGPRRINSSASVPMPSSSQDNRLKKGKRLANENSKKVPSLEKHFEDNTPNGPRRINSSASVPMPLSSQNKMVNGKKAPRKDDDLKTATSVKEPIRGVKKSKSMYTKREAKKPENDQSLVSEHSSLSLKKEPVRGVQKSKSFDGLSKVQKKPKQKLSFESKKEPKRGVKKTKSLNTIKKMKYPPKKTEPTSTTLESKKEPPRGVKKSKSWDGMVKVKKDSKWNSRKKEPSRGVKKTISLEVTPKKKIINRFKGQNDDSDSEESDFEMIESDFESDSEFDSKELSEKELGGEARDISSSSGESDVDHNDARARKTQPSKKKYAQLEKKKAATMKKGSKQNGNMKKGFTGSDTTSEEGLGSRGLSDVNKKIYSAEMKTFRKISMDGSVKSWWDLDEE